MPFAPSLILFGLPILLGQVPGLTSDLSARAAASPRPAECVSVERARTGSGPEIWNRARHPELAAYCAALARGYSVLAADPRAAADAADRAEAAKPGQAATRVLRARALLAEGSALEAWAEFEAAGSMPWSVRSPEALHDRAIAASLARHMPEAVSAYRALVPRVELLDDSGLRERIYVEAALHVMALGPESLDEAIGYLTEARRAGAEPGLSPVVLGALALALDRQGKTALARGVAAEAGPATVLTSLELDPALPEVGRKAAIRKFLPVFPPGEPAAIIAIVADAHGSSLAREYWQTFLDQNDAGARWAEHARAKLAAHPVASSRGAH